MKIVKNVSITCSLLILFFAFCLTDNSSIYSKPAFATAETIEDPVVKLVVLDPGHGGKDPGAIGPGGVLEKDVVLEVAKKAKALIESRSKIQVKLTREEDVFVPLRQRAKFANSIGANVFISIHANAAKRSAWGFETYFLSEKASDDEARSLALMENNALKLENELENELPPGIGSDIEAILFDMVQMEHIKESEALAVIIQEQLSLILDSPDRGVKQAPFAVLMGAAMPAVLVELGFVSSRREVKLLTDAEVQGRIATAIADSVFHFAKRREKKLKRKSPEHLQGE